jgi:hypothetical protein
MAWIPIEQSLPGNKKTIKVAVRLGISPVQVVGHLVTLWLWSVTNSDNGILENDPDMIAFGAGYTGDASGFVEALKYAKYLEIVDSGLYIHDWHEYAGKYIEKRKISVQRVQRWRSEHTTNDTVTHNDHVTNAGVTLLEESRVEERRVEERIKEKESPLPPKMGAATKVAEVATLEESILPSQREYEPHADGQSPKGSNVTKSACARFCEAYKAKFDVSYQMPKVETLELGRKLWCMGNVEFDKALVAFFQSDDTFITGRSFCGADFTKQINRWVLESRGKTPPSRNGSGPTPGSAGPEELLAFVKGETK